MIDRGDAPTRDRDFADVAMLTARHRVHADRLAAAIAATARHRRTPLRPLGDTLVTLAADRQNDWERFIARAGLKGAVPSAYQETIAQVIVFADPILSGTVTSGTWAPEDARWRP